MSQDRTLKIELDGARIVISLSKDGERTQVVPTVMPVEVLPLERITPLEIQPVDDSPLFENYFEQWLSNRKHQMSKGWGEEMAGLFNRYVKVELGHIPTKSISPEMVVKVLSRMAELGRSPQTQLHVYSILHAAFSDAIEVSRLIQFNPVLKRFKPKVAIKEARHLTLNESKKLLAFVDGKPYGFAIWLQLYMGLRVGELLALQWEDINLDAGKLHVRRAFVRKDKSIKDYPKGRRHHTAQIPGELLDRIKKEKTNARGELVCTDSKGERLSYERYCAALKRYCKELDLPVIASHGLRHSTSEVYMSFGATRDDIRELFAHSSPVITERYLHSHGTNLEKVSNSLKLFPSATQEKPSPDSLAAS